MTTKTFAVIEDPGHGWLEVPRSLIDELGIHGDISVFSYIKGATAYLEEDRDMTIFLNAFGKAYPSTEVKLRERYVNCDSAIRNYRPYPALEGWRAAS